jgi:hypothetical protein
MSKNVEDTGAIRRLPKTGVGDPDDGVEMMAQCNVMNFTVKGKEVTGIGSQHIANCKMMASFENGVVSISVRDGRPFMVSVRLDELMALLKEAADYRNENDQKKKEEENHE